MAKINLGDYQLNSPEYSLDPVTGLTNKPTTVKAADIFRVASTSAPLYNINLPTDFGESRYDAGLYEEDIYNLPEARAQRQSTIDKWSNATAKMGITALTTFLDGTVGTVIGLANMGEYDNPMTGFVNNPFSQAMLDVQEWSERALPNYYTQQEQETPWYENLGTANFWADKVLKNFGFAIGAYAAGALTAGAGATLTGSRALQASLGSKVGKGLMTKLLTGSLDDAAEKALLTELTAGGRGLTDDLVKGIIQDSKKLKTLNLTNQIIGSIGGAVGEARIEAGHAIREFTEEAKAELDARYQSGQISDDQYQTELQDIEKKSLSVGNHVFALNTAILSASNFAQFRHAFAGGYEMQKKAIGQITRDATTKEFAATLPTTTLGKVARKAGAIGVGFKNALVEGNEEMLQRVASESSKDHYRRMLDGAEGGADEFINSIWEGFGNTYGNVDAWEEFVIGAFSGGIGIPTIQNKKIQIAGGIWSDLSEQTSKDKRTAAVVDKLNQIIKTPQFQARYFALNQDMASETAKQKALTNDDIFEWKTEDDAQFAHMVNTFYNAGQLDQLYDWIDGMEKATPDEIREFMAMNKVKDSDGKVIESPEVVDYFKNVQPEEISKRNKERAAKLRAKIAEIQEVREAIDVKFGGTLSDEGKNILASQLIGLRSIDTREQNIHEQISKINNLFDGRAITDIARKASSLTTRSGWINTFNNKSRAAKSQITRLNNLVQALEDKVIEAQSKGDVATAVRSRRAAATEAAKTSKWRDKIAEYKEKIENLQKDLDSMLQEEYEARTKLVESSPELYQDMTFDEYRNEVMSLSDRIDEFEDLASKSYGRVGENPITPDRAEKLNTYMKDLFKLNSLRMGYLKNYIDSVEKLQKDPKAFEKMRKEVENEIADRNADSMIKRVLSGAEKLRKGFNVKNNETGEEFRVKKVGDGVRVLGKNSIGSFSIKTDIKVDKEFTKNYTPSAEFDILQETLNSKLQELVEEGKATIVDVNNSGISVIEDKLVASGSLVTFTTTRTDEATNVEVEVTEKYLKAPDGKYYRIYNEGEDSALVTRAYSDKYFENGKLTDASTKITVPFEGKVMVNQVTGEKYLVKSEHIPELDAIINKQEELSDLSDSEQIKANIEAQELEDDSPFDNVSTESLELNNPNKVLLVLTQYKGKDNKGNWITKTQEIKDTPEGRDVLQKHIKQYSDNNDGASLFGDIFAAIRNKTSNPVLEINGVKYRFSFPKNPPKKVILVARNKKNKRGKVTWGKPIHVTDREELSNLIKEIKTSKKGSKYVIKGNKFYYVKEVDYLGDNAKYNHWRYSFNIVSEKDGKFVTTLYDKPESEIENFAEFLTTAKEGVDYIKTKTGYKVFRVIDRDDTTGVATVKETYRSTSKQKNDSGKWVTKRYNLYDEVSTLSNVEVSDNAYRATDKHGNRIGIPRQMWKYPITTINGNTNIGKGSEFDYEDRTKVFVEGITYGGINVVTEPTEAKSFDPDAKFELIPNALFAGTFPEIDPVVGSEKGIDNQPDKVKRVITYLNNNNLKDGNHSVLIASGQSIGDTSTDDNAKSVKIIVSKKNPDGKIQPIDVNGNFITLEEVYERGIFQEAPLPERFSSVESLIEEGKYAVKDSKSIKANGEISIPTTKEKVDREVARYKAWYDKVSKDVMADGYAPKSHTILKVTQGINLQRADKSSAPTRDSLHETIGKGNYKLHIGTNESTTLFSGAKVKLNPGYVYLEDLKSGNIFQLQTNKLTNTQQETVIQLLKTFVSNFTVQEDGKISMEGAGNYMGMNLFKDGLDNIVYFQDRNNITKEGREKLYNLVDRINALNLSIFRFIENPEVEAAGLAEAERKSLIREYYAIKEGLNREYQINSNPKTQFYFLDHPDIPGGLVVIGGEKDGKILPLLDQTDIKTKTLNPEVESALKEFLPQRNMNVVKSKKKLNNDDPFTTLVYENGELISKNYDSYNDYVIDNTTTESLEYGEDANSTVSKKIVFEVLEKDSKIPPSPKTDKFNDEPDFPDVDIDELRSKAVSSGKGMNLNDMLKNKSQTITDTDSVENPPSLNDFMDEPDFSKAVSKGSAANLPTNTKPSNPFSKLRVVRDKNGRLSLENKKAFMAWMSEKFGDQFVTDFVRLENVIVEGRWGEFTDNLIVLYADATEGTGFHEAFHAVVSMFMSDAEFNRLVDQVKSDKRFIQRLSEVKKLYPTLDERALIEEVLAEEFSDYVLTNGESLNGRKQPKLKGLFGFLQRILNWFTGKNKDLIADTFSRINSGYYRNVSPNLTRGFNISKKSAKVKQTLRGDKQFEVDAMNTVSAAFFGNLYSNEVVPNGLYEIFGKDGIDPATVKKVYDATRADIESYLEYHKSNKDLDSTTKQRYIEGLQYLLDNWESEIIPYHKRYLRKFGIEEEVEDSSKDDNAANRSESGAAYNYSSLKVSAKASSTKMMKALIGGLAKKNADNTLVFNNIGGAQLSDFGKLFSILSNHLANTTTLEEKLPILQGLYDKVPEIRKLVEGILRIETFLENPLDFNAKDVETLAKFNQTFSKNMNRYVMSLMGADGQFKIIDANAETLQGRIKTNWKAKFSKSIEGSGSSKVVKKGLVHYYNPSFFKAFGENGRLKDYYGFANAVGIYADKVAIDNTMRGEVDFLSSLYKNIMAGNQPSIFSNTFDADFTGRLGNFIQSAIEGSVDFVENAHFNSEGDLVYNNTVNSPISIMFNKLNKISKLPKEERVSALGNELPFLSTDFTYNANSMILNAILSRKNGININIEINEASRIEGDDAKSFKDFSEPERLYNWYQMAAQGKYVLMRPSDNSIERFITIPNVFSTKMPKEILLGYIKDELNFAADTSNFRFKNFANNRYKGILLDILAEAKDHSIYEEAKAAIDSNSIDRFIIDRGNEIYMILDRHIKDVTASVAARFAEYKITSNMLNKDYTIEQFVTEHLYMAIEQTKLITGNISLFKNMDDMFKRNSAVANTKKISWVGKRGSGIELWIANKLKRFDKGNPSSDDYWYNDSPVLRTMIINDVVSTSKYVEEYRKILGDRAEGYNNYDETDGFSFQSADEHREFHFRAGEWNQELEDRYQYEMQMFMHHMISKHDAKMKPMFKKLFNIDYDSWVSPINPETGKKIKLNPKIKINSVKPQYRGPLAIDGFYPTMYKTSFLPIYPSLFMDLKSGEITNKNLYNLFYQMSKNSVGVVSFYSANKGATTMINTPEEIQTSANKNDLRKEVEQPLYNVENGTISTFDNYIIQPTFYEYWGIQVDTGFKEKGNVVYGTQMLKQLRNGVFNRGIPVSGKESLGELIKKFESINNKRISHGLKLLEKKLGLVFENGQWTYDDSTETFINALEREAINRNMPDNVLNSIYYLGESKLPIDALINSDKMQTILFSMADKLTLSQKAFGKAPYQVPSTLFEKDGIRVMEDFKGIKRIVSNDLEFYGFDYDDSGNITGVKSMEVYLPSYLKGVVNVGEVTDKKLLQLIGFRIPTQGLNSIESIVVKGFLSDAYGDVIVLPSEIVAKTGSDFDIDKMNVYIPNYYEDENGQFVVYGSKDKNYFLSVYKKKIDSIVSRLKKESTGGLGSKYLNTLIDTIKPKISDKDGAFELEDLLEELIRESSNRVTPPAELSAMIFNLEEAISSGEDSTAGLSMEQYDLKVVENEMFDVMQEIILHKDNARQLLNPIDSDFHKELAKKFRLIHNRNKSKKASSVKSSNKNMFHLYANPLHHLQVAKQNMEGAGAIGIAANAAVFHIYASLHDFGITKEFINYKTKVENGKQQSEKVSTQLNLEHNKRDDGSISIGGIKDVKNDLYIYEAFNAYITLTVDNAKDPVLDDLNSGLKTINTVLYLIMAGVPYETVHYFMNQPSIVRYLENMSIYESQILKANSTFGGRLDKFTDEILQITLEEFGFTGEPVLNSPLNKTYSLEELKTMVDAENITPYNKTQVNLLLDFIRYQRTASEVGKAIQSMQYDTKSFGRNEAESVDLIKSTEEVIKKGVVTNVEKAFTEGFLGAYRDTMEKVLDRFSQFSLILREPNLKIRLKELLDRYQSDKMKIGRERRLEVLNAWRKDAMTYLILSKKFKTIRDGEFNSPMVDRIDKLFKGENSIPSRILRIKNIIERGNARVNLVGEEKMFYEFFKNNKLIEQLNPEIDSEKPIHNLTLHSRRLDATESDLITEGWRDMINSNIPLAYDLIEFALLQSGMQGSPMTMIEFIPFEIFGNIVNSVLSQDISIEDATRYSVQFYINNYVNKDIVKKASAYQQEKDKLPFEAELFPVYKITAVKPGYEKYTFDQLMDLVRKGVQPWQSKPDLYLTATNEKIPDFGNTRAFRDKSSLMVYGTKDMNKFSDKNMGAITMDLERLERKLSVQDRVSDMLKWQDKNC